MQLFRRTVVATLSAAVVALGCASSSGPSGSEVRILLNDGDVDGTVRVQVDGPRCSPITRGISFGNFLSDEYPGAQGATYGQVNFITNGNAIDVVCSSGWQ